jgi:hypothetical protein
MEEISDLVKKNMRKIEEILEAIESCCSVPSPVDAILTKVCDRYDLDLNANQYVLITSTIKSYLSFLRDAGRLEIRFDGGQPLWKIAR